MLLFHWEFYVKLLKHNSMDLTLDKVSLQSIANSMLSMWKLQENECWHFDLKKTATISLPRSAYSVLQNCLRPPKQRSNSCSPGTWLPSEITASFQINSLTLPWNKLELYHYSFNNHYPLTFKIFHYINIHYFTHQNIDFSFFPFVSYLSS